MSELINYSTEQVVLSINTTILLNNLGFEQSPIWFLRCGSPLEKENSLQIMLKAIEKFAYDWYEQDLLLESDIEDFMDDCMAYCLCYAEGEII